MPIYEFKCEICGEIFESLQKMGEDFPPCPKCNSNYVINYPLHLDSKTEVQE
jgi:putative regulatory protein, FmdB family